MDLVKENDMAFCGTKKELMEHLSYVKDNDIIAVDIWGMDDVKEKAEDSYGICIADEQASNVLSMMASSHDCEIGMNWDTLEYHLENEINVD